ncbi:MAG: hypothetical protein Unbinned3065contig1007_38 [Prokaryotic dsDNA virus sp.]|nr:MAG: hypothetical protein Unbinned3065contig1007_38 [Prokaryotic dsDNA virus sp.]|tara:strand:- start:5460 stop:5942 length:483 start_codon:yes stop_codon:yes gene_type:complete
MIQAITETNLTAYVQTLDNKITTLADTQIRYLWKFTNKMSKKNHYNYARTETITERFTKSIFSFSPTRDIYTGWINFIPSGHYTYEVYEVAWDGTVTVSEGYAPKNENDVLFPPASDKGVVQGLVTKGIMYVADKSGTAQVQYTQHPEPSGTNYIYYGQE